jgi:hypothetical protein
MDSVPAFLATRPHLWSGADDPAGQAEVKIASAGWIRLNDARKRLEGYLSFAKQVHDEGLTVSSSLAWAALR